MTKKPTMTADLLAPAKKPAAKTAQRGEDQTARRRLTFDLAEDDYARLVALKLQSRKPLHRLCEDAILDLLKKNKL